MLNVNKYLNTLTNHSLTNNKHISVGQLDFDLTWKSLNKFKMSCSVLPRPVRIYGRPIRIFVRCLSSKVTILIGSKIIPFAYCESPDYIIFVLVLEVSKGKASCYARRVLRKMSTAAITALELRHHHHGRAKFNLYIGEQVVCENRALPSALGLRGPTRNHHVAIQRTILQREP